MTDGNVAYAVQDGVAYLTFDNPRLRNAMTWRMYEQLMSHCDVLDGDPDVRVAVLRGAGGTAFVAGTDIRQFQTFEGGEDGIAYEAKVEAVVSRLERVRVPTVAVVEGYAVGGGMALAAVCDLRLCTSDARFGVPIARTLGNCLSSRNHSRLISLLGTGRTKDLLLTGRLMDASEALTSGFVRAVLATEDLQPYLTKLLDQLRANAPVTQRVTKESIRRLMIERDDEDADLLMECYGSEDFREGVRAFLEKRKPGWHGR